MHELIHVYIWNNRGWYYLDSTRMHATLASARRAFARERPRWRIGAAWAERGDNARIWG